MRYIIAALFAFSLTACGTVNPFVSGLETKAQGDYATAKANVE